MNTLPAERDLPPAAHAAARADLVAAVAGRPARPRRWLPAAAAAALLAVVAGTVVTVHEFRDDPPTPVAAPVSPATLLDRCTNDVLRQPGRASPEMTAGGPMTFRNVVTDRYGRLVWGVNDTVVLVCQYDTADHGGPGQVVTRLGTGPMTYLPAGGSPVTATYNSTNPLRSGSEPAAWAWPVQGHVRADVARLVVTAPGCEPVEVAVDGPYYVTRMIEPASRTAPFDPTITAYDKDGRVLGTAD